MQALEEQINETFEKALKQKTQVETENKVLQMRVKELEDQLKYLTSINEENAIKVFLFKKQNIFLTFF